MSIDQTIAPVTAEFSEKAILAAILSSADREATDQFEAARAILPSPAMFTNPRYAAVYAAIMAVVNDGAAINMWSVGTKLGQAQTLAKVGGEEFLRELTMLVNDYPITESAGEVRTAYRRKRIVETLQGAAQSAGSAVDLGSAIASVQAELDAIDAGFTNGADELISADALFDEFWDNVENPKPMVSYTTGLVDLDDAIGGLVPGTMTVVAARPGGGKSLLLMKMARSVATQGYLDRHEPVPTLVVSLEMNKAELEFRRVAAVAGVEFSHLKRSQVTAWDKQQIMKVRDVLRNMPLELLAVTSINVPQIKAYARKVAAKHGQMPVIFVDYIQLMESTSNTRADLRQIIIGEVSRALKVLAMELNTPVVVAAQLNRGSSTRTDKRPLVTDLRESGNIENDADVVLLLHREADYDDTAPGEEMVIIAGKNRNGIKGAVVPALWLPHRSEIANYAHEDGSHDPVAKAAPVPAFASDWSPSAQGY